MQKCEIKQLLEYSALAYQSGQPAYNGIKTLCVDDRQKDIQFYLRFKDDLLQIVFRGSDSLTDAVTDIKFWKKTVPYDNGGSPIRVHTGFLEAYKRPQVRGVIHKAVTHSVKRIQVSGHSLGAALAVLCAVDLQYNFPDRDFEVVVFGCPRVGNKAFADSYNRRVFKTVRVENGGDIVTMIPFRIMGYCHVGAKLHIGKHRLPNAKDHSLTKYYSSLWAREIWG